MNFNEEVIEIKKCLKLDDSITVLSGEDAMEYINKHDSLYREKYNISIKKNFDNAYGYYLWWEDEHVVLVKDPNDYINLAHELRHAWQFIHKKEYGFVFKKHKGSKMKEWLYNVFVYPLTKTELDANKFAYRYAKSKKLSIKRPLKAILLNKLYKLVILLIIVDVIFIANQFM